MAFLFWEGEFHKGNYDIYLRDFGGEGGNGFGKRLSWYQGNHHIYMGAYSRQGTIACRVRIGCWFMVWWQGNFPSLEFISEVKTWSMAHGEG